MSETPYRICTRCVMDTSDPEITFDAEGVCNHCRGFVEYAASDWFPTAEGAKRLQDTIDAIKREGSGRPYDCILGLSGGVDSSYLALKVKEFGLRPLVIHVDAGWNSETAVQNIERIVKHCGFDLHTVVIDWEDMRDLQLAYLRAAISNQDVPQDHVFFASLYEYATRHGIRYVLSGGNIATESIFPSAWHGDAMDAANLKAIHKRYGDGRLRSYTIVSFFKYFFWYPFVKGMRTVRPLNYMPYNRADAEAELTRAIGWRSYGRKHCESVFTKFFQSYYLPHKFGYDKRRPHYSSLIVSGQMTRAEALAHLAEPLYSPAELDADLEYFCKKLRLSRQEFQALLDAPIHHYSEFPNQDRLYRAIKRVQRWHERIFRRRVKVYS
jgi:N-acetyl sugar amidotransferase